MVERVLAGVAGLAAVALAAALSVAPAVRPAAGTEAAAVERVRDAPRDARGWVALAQARMAEAGWDSRAGAGLRESYRAGPRDARAGFRRLALILPFWPLMGTDVRAAALAELEALAAWPEAAGVTRGFLHDPAVWPHVCALPDPDRARVMALSRALSVRRAVEPACPA
ncbi:hypothetical protein [Futiania mangrovi]|uniref:Uncharacterized protein n=1 Tax=Futiania mangrovi TaxID=2959716 RepID=A0A9J6P7W6_9PROT|nr:hypothetical protein [Futiania mangrovii]MCP1335356.1 hypothetical protein [Futiania mangrovii]